MMIAMEAPLTANPLLAKIKEAAKENRIAQGPHRVWKEVCRKNAQLLLIENNYSCYVYHVDMENICIAADTAEPVDAFKKDLLHDIITQTLQSGGAVRYVEEGTLKEYGKIILQLLHPPLRSIY